MEYEDFKIVKKVGATVILRSGGVIMTISRIDGDDIYCKWFDKQDKLHEETFKEYELSLKELDVTSAGKELKAITAKAEKLTEEITKDL